MRKSVFEVTTFELLDFVAHMGDQEGEVGLSIGGSIVHPGGFYDSEKQFGTAAALVFVNACSSIRAAAQFYSPRSFPQDFISFHVPAVVASAAARRTRPGAQVRQPLLRGSGCRRIDHKAVRNARKALMADDSTGLEVERRRLAAAAYCVFAHPMMPIKFKRGANE